MKKKMETQNQKAEIRKVTTVAELAAVLDAPLRCRFAIDGQVLEVPVQRMSARTAEQVRELLRKAKPPFNKALGDRGDYDLTSEPYQKERDDNLKRARSLMIYAHCPLVAANKPGLTALADIHNYVQGLFTESVLEVISIAIQGGGLEEVEERVNFTSAPGSES
jgi:hypothetical protein